MDTGQADVERDNQEKVATRIIMLEAQKHSLEAEIERRDEKIAELRKIVNRLTSVDRDG